MCREIFEEVADASGGSLRCQGQGLMWGGLFDDDSARHRNLALLCLVFSGCLVFVARTCDSERIRSQSRGKPHLMTVSLCAGKERRQAAAAILKRHCTGDGGVWPYFVPVGGFMVTPPLVRNSSVSCEHPAY